MPKQSYQFFRMVNQGGEEILEKPWLPIRFINPMTGEHITVRGLIDSGADTCLFPTSLCACIGHNLKADGVKSNRALGVEQKPVRTWRHTFILELLSPDLKKILWSTKKPAEFDCSEAEPPVLLGVDDFLRNFDVTLSYRKGVVTLER